MVGQITGVKVTNGVCGSCEVEESTAAREGHVESVLQSLPGGVLWQLQEIETEIRENHP